MITKRKIKFQEKHSNLFQIYDSDSKTLLINSNCNNQKCNIVLKLFDGKVECIYGRNVQKTKK